MNILHSTTGLLSLLLLAQVSIAEENANTEITDYLFLDGKIFTVDSTLPHAEAVAVKDNRIIFVGTNHEAAAYIGPDTNITNLSGAMILPGFIDGHNHIVSGAYVKQGVNLDGSKNKAAIIDKVQAYVKEHPDLSGYTGYGWFPCLEILPRSVWTMIQSLISQFSFSMRIPIIFGLILPLWRQLVFQPRLRIRSPVPGMNVSRMDHRLESLLKWKHGGP